MKELTKYDLILASKSPRRKQLLDELGLKYRIIAKDVPEDYHGDLKREEVALFLSELKANAFSDELHDHTIVIAADTIVCINDMILGKPINYDDAVRILKILSGKKHEVITGVTLKGNKKMKSFFVLSEVYFKNLTDEEIHYYISNYEPYDKAGAYGIQEWIGLIGIEKINGSYCNVMGLPVKELYEELLQFTGS